MSTEYSVYQKVIHSDGRSEWVGMHRLPIAYALKVFREFRNRGYRACFRKDGEPGPSYKD